MALCERECVQWFLSFCPPLLLSSAWLLPFFFFFFCTSISNTFEYQPEIQSEIVKLISLAWVSRLFYQCFINVIFMRFFSLLFTKCVHVNHIQSLDKMALWLPCITSHKLLIMMDVLYFQFAVVHWIWCSSSDIMSSHKLERVKNSFTYLFAAAMAIPSIHLFWTFCTFSTYSYFVMNVVISSNF